MQTQAIQNPALNTSPSPARSGLQGEDDQQFKLTLARQMEAQPVSAPASAPARPAAKQANAPAPAAQASRQQAQSAQQARSQQANAAGAPKQAGSAQAGQQAEAADAADASQAAASAEPAEPVTEQAAAATPADSATDAVGADSSAVDPVTDMLAMVAAYNQAGAADNTAAQAAAAAAAAIQQAAQPAPAVGAAQQEIAAIGASGKESAAPAAADSLLAADSAGERSAVDAALAAVAPADATPVTAEGKADAKAGKAGTGFTLPAELQGKPEQAAGVQAPRAENKPAEGAALRAPAEMMKAEAAPAPVPDAAPAAPQPVAPQAAQQLAQTAQAANAAASNQLHARVGSNAWDQQLGQKVVWMVAGGDQSASLTLNPPDLGPLQVVLNVSNDQASATFSSAELEVRQAIENALPKLKEMMSEAGIQLGNATVSSGMSDQQQAFAEAAANRSGNGGARFGAGSVAAETEAPAPVVRRSVLGAVDTFA
ncbi:flagellar hook-length control protein FliK [Massilia endophytica]|uniref:flagellar hook-length control protein FliK n=1 Tax=Massilia endophytica TaxID=2899220 RepID=UPI001E62F841|nr:flagellar hook-length control protein FliK [Massilia endophytica]UGQ45215.1 flagellar hook-length control protein FliK [Massilia endophytica]